MRSNTSSASSCRRAARAPLGPQLAGEVPRASAARTSGGAETEGVGTPHTRRIETRSASGGERERLERVLAVERLRERERLHRLPERDDGIVHGHVAGDDGGHPSLDPGRRVHRVLLGRGADPLHLALGLAPRLDRDALGLVTRRLDRCRGRAARHRDLALERGLVAVETLQRPRSPVGRRHPKPPRSSPADARRTEQASGRPVPGWGCTAGPRYARPMPSSPPRSSEFAHELTSSLSALLLGLQRLRALQGGVEKERALALLERMETAVRGMAALLETLRPPGPPAHS